ncbi:hypothetical protein [Flavivirga eckloniae]|uniref:Uncharacterized protein n=1 Tax=Flavivirga eckloniae TaxID=1803846 RepID=A0A2K9PUM6_9FLAO|nr:hypothetical protein [Flavivirga eckloniae]AUP80772.1 hypothetical protein C1H87_19455 [Flavivirga eckloniae]
MKTSTSKNNEGSNSHSSTPFFNKGHFFSQNQNTKTPFFAPSSKSAEDIADEHGTSASSEPLDYIESGFDLTRHKMETLKREDIIKSSLKTKSGRLLRVSYDEETYNRMKKDLEEGLAIYYEAWRIGDQLPKSFFSEPQKVHIEYINIPLEEEQTASNSSVNYKLTFYPDSSISIDLVQSPYTMESTTLDKKSKRRAKHFKRLGSWEAFGLDRIEPLSPLEYTFPNQNPDEYFKQHPEIELLLYSKLRELWKANKKSTEDSSHTFFIAAKESPNRKAIFEMTVNLRETGRHREIDSTVEYAMEDLTREDSINDPIAGFDKEEFLETHTEKEIKDLQQNDHPKISGRKLGKITGIDLIPEAEKALVRHTIMKYYRSFNITATDPETMKKVEKNMDNAEVDVIIPIPDTKTDVYYTLRFRTFSPQKGAEETNVEVVRIGKPGKDFFDPNLPDIRRAPEFPRTKDINALKTWIGKRYTEDAFQIDTEIENFDELVTQLNAQLQNNVTDPEWFKKAYGLNIINDSDTARKLLKKLLKDTLKGIDEKEKEKHLGGTKPFTPGELILLELSLETINTDFLKKIRSTSLIRQEVVFSENKEWGGLAHSHPQKAIRMADESFEKSDSIFYGSNQGVHNSLVKPLVHEFGHVVAYSNELKWQKAFDKYAEKHKLKPITDYANWGDHKKEFRSELYAESHTLFLLDPEWLLKNHPKVFFWFDELNKNGEPPKIE